MKILIIQGSPRKNGNTAKITNFCAERLQENGCEVENLWLGDFNVGPCLGCMACQENPEEPGCVQKDDAEAIWKKIAEADILILASPIYTWYCTAQMKNFLDRHYAVNKYYGSAAEKNGKYSLVKDLSVALITTHGYKPDYANDLFETGIKRFCRHSGWDYLGLYSERDTGKGANLDTPEIRERAKAFADSLVEEWKNNRI